VRFYCTYGSVRAVAKLVPKRPYATVTSALQRKVGWRTVQTISLSTGASSLMAVQLYAASPGYELRFLFRFPGDSYNKSSSKASAPFEVLH
jgi:hypothetical protein